MPEDDLSDLDNNTPEPVVVPAPLRLLIEMLDFDEIQYTHFQAPGSLILTFPDFPDKLQNRLRPILYNMQQRRIEHLDFDSRRRNPVLANHQPFDLRFLKENEDFEELIELIVWWIERDRRQKICRKDILDYQPHKTWTCECGQIVNVEKELKEICDNPDCPSWVKYRLCTGKSPKQHLRRA